ncbi:MAG: hypothetical protein ACI4T2_02510 [Christensenellales bacterium]
MTIANDEKNLIMNVILSCNELIDGKFILADSKISKILQDITESKEVYNLLSECMANFNFDREFIRAKIKLPTKPGYFKMPDEKYKILPMVFCILVDISKHKIDFQSFLKDYFSSEDGKISEYENFANEVIKPFRNAISDMFELPLVIEERVQKIQKNDPLQEHKERIEAQKRMNEERKEQKMEEQSQQTKPEFEEPRLTIFGDITKIVNEIIATIQYDYHLKPDLKDNATIMLQGIKRACELEDFKLLNALLIGFDYVGGGIKSIRFIYKELKETIADFYANLG